MKPALAQRLVRWVSSHGRHGLAAALPLLWVAQAMALWRLDRHAVGVAAEAYAGAGNILLNALPGWAFALCLAALTRRLLFPLLVTSAIQVAVYLASLKKLEVLGSPFALQDVYFLTTINRATLELFGSYVEHPAWWLAATAGFLGLLAACFWLERPWFRWFGAVQAVLLLAMGVALYTLDAGKQPWASFYDAQRVRPSTMSLTPAVVRSGLFSSLVYKHLQARNMRFEIDGDALRDVLAGLEPAPARPLAASAPPDVVIVLSESFMDPRILNGLSATQDTIPATRALIGAGHGGTMTVPTYGGGTVRTEFEVLTGMPAEAFPDAFYPYVDLDRTVLPSLPGLLRRQGYATVAVHGNSGAFWNRSDTYASMGFDRFVTGREFARRGMKREGTWYSDSAMTDIVLQELAEHGGPTFVMAVSIQNHGPYTTLPKDVDQGAWKAIELPPGLEGEGALELRNCLYHLHRADAQLARLLQALEARGRPYVLAFFGDHLPALGSAYASLGFVDGAPPERQRVPWVLVAGEGTQRRAASATRHLYSWELPAQVLDAAGISDSYFRFIQALGLRLEHATESDEEQRLRRGLVAGANARMEFKFEEYADAH
ncbi:sulfatase-like hydrolase/transferase [Pseudoxanthomonas broegbernensis]|uniref:sulfatase-like hydrolase/transferase n=1 Tax=Pseudoxanthomonas broegbernensis TaxID=83619 RepID=UPI001391781F|nr:sulfatase-like hydrolase/transferase [Pseudoxanthomonas broegbernensis]MBB6063638.1 phosphoglycerol transferase MdoB-like AlkP superfamily enzyme [Pseudoxanthomonas broegbernensis]